MANAKLTIPDRFCGALMAYPTFGEHEFKNKYGTSPSVAWKNARSAILQSGPGAVKINWRGATAEPAIVEKFESKLLNALDQLYSLPSGRGLIEYCLTNLKIDICPVAKATGWDINGSTMTAVTAEDFPEFATALGLSKGFTPPPTARHKVFVSPRQTDWTDWVLTGVSAQYSTVWDFLEVRNAVGTAAKASYDLAKLGSKFEWPSASKPELCGANIGSKFAELADANTRLKLAMSLCKGVQSGYVDAMISAGHLEPSPFSLLIAHELAHLVQAHVDHAAIAKIARAYLNSRFPTLFPLPYCPYLPQEVVEYFFPQLDTTYGGWELCRDLLVTPSLRQGLKEAIADKPSGFADCRSWLLAQTNSDGTGNLVSNDRRFSVIFSSVLGDLLEILAIRGPHASVGPSASFFHPESYFCENALRAEAGGLSPRISHWGGTSGIDDGKYNIEALYDRYVTKPDGILVNF